MPDDQRPLTPGQKQTARELPWYRSWLLASGRTEAEVGPAPEEDEAP